MQKSIGRMFLEGTVASSLVLFVVMVAIGLAAGQLPLIEILGWATLAAVGCGLLLGLFYASIVYLNRAGHQEREAILPCDFDAACAHCLASLEQFPNRRLLDSAPGTIEALVNNNPMLAKLPPSMTPQKWGWVERVKLTVSPSADGKTTVKIETYADMNRSLQVVFEKRRHNADIIREYLLSSGQPAQDLNGA